MHKLDNLFWEYDGTRGFEEQWYLLTASSEASRTSPGTIDRNDFPAWDFTTGAITDPVANWTPSSILLLIFSVILDTFLTLEKDKAQLC